MAVFDLSTPDGAKYRIDAPDENAALGALKSMLGGGAAPARERGAVDLATQVPVGIQ
jgi:hypothetical protein